MQHLDEGTIHAWLDAGLDAEESARVEQHVAECAMCANAVAEARGLVAGASRILAALDDVPTGVIPRSGGALGGGGGGSSTSGRSRSLWNVLHLTPARAAAAAFLIVAAGTALVMREGTEGAQRAAISVASRPGGAAAKLPVPATPLPATTSADTTAMASSVQRDVVKKRTLEMAAPSAAGGAEAPQRQTAVPGPVVPGPARGEAFGNRNASPLRAAPRIDGDSASIVQRYVPVPAPPPATLADSIQRQALEKRAAERSTVVGGALRPAAVMRAAVTLPSAVNYAGCYSVASRGDVASPLPKLVSLDSARFGKALADQFSANAQLFAVSDLTTDRRHSIDTASWQPLLDGVRISFGRTPMDLRRRSDSTLSVAGVAGRGYAVTLQRVDCPPR